MPDQPPASRKPQRSAASTALWAHLLRKDAIPDASNASTLPSNPPLVPFDKAGTSMRILLHDTQANFEKFSERADKLFGAVSETKRETITMQQLFQDDREKLVGQTVDLVNRCQTEIQKSLGTPAQSHKLDDLFNEAHLTRVKMDALDKRVDSLQMLNHAQSQALQAIQDQQAQMIAVLLPLLPLLQAVPLHIDAAKNTINERILESQKAAPVTSPSGVARLISCFESHSSFTHSQETAHSGKRKRLRTSHDDFGDIDRDGSQAPNRTLHVHLDPPASKSVHAQTHAQTSEHPAEENDNKNDARAVVSDSATSIELRPQSKWPTSGVLTQQNPLRPSKSQSQFQNPTPTPTHRSLVPFSSPDSQAPRRPLADLMPIASSPAPPTDGVQVNYDGRRHFHVGSVDSGTSFLDASNVFPGTSVIPRSLSPHTAHPSSVNPIQTSFPTASTPPPGSSSISSSVSSSTARTVAEQPNSSFENSHDGSSGYSTNQMLLSGPEPPPQPVPPLLIPMVLNSAVRNIDAGTDDTGSFLVPMIKPVTTQRSWTSIRNNGKRFIPLDDYDEDVAFM